jgi:hypothetical protein
MEVEATEHLMADRNRKDARGCGQDMPIKVPPSEAYFLQPGPDFDSQAPANHTFKQ